MTAPTYPPTLREPIAANASSGFITNPMPESPTGTNGASIEGGFPAITMTSELAGGKPPLGQDMNGFLFLLSTHLVFLQAGEPYLFNSDVATALGGYPVGSILGMNDGSGLWINTIANNSTAPDGTTGYTAGWRPLYDYGVGTVATTGGLLDVPAQTARKSIIIVTGTLAANATIRFPQVVQSWLVVNATTGPFTLSAFADGSPGSGGGAGMIIPPGGRSAPTGIYSTADGNVYPTVAPLGIAIDQAATPSTIVERTNTGQVLATYFNMEATSDNLAFTQIAVGAGDGFIRWNDTLVFQAALDVGNFSGHVTNAQVPVGAVTQYAAAILASAALTGNPTAPTAALGDSDTSVATTAFVNPGSSITGAGPWFRKEPDGSIRQWGQFSTTANAGLVSIPFAISFPNANQGVRYSVRAASGVGGAGSYENYITAEALANFNLQLVAGANNAVIINWECIGR